MIPRIFIDTNVIIDLLGDRMPFYEDIAKIATLAEKGKLIIVVSAISFTTVDYILSKFESPKIAREKLRKFNVICTISRVDEHTIEKGLNSPFMDFEDGLQFICATDSGCEIILTRNGKDFKKSTLPVMTPREFLINWRENNRM